MLTSESSYDFRQFVSLRRLIRLRGRAMMIFGFTLAVLCIVKPDVRVMSSTNSWMPFVSILLLAVGGLECFDAYFSRHSKEFLLNLQLANFDTVIGLFLLFGIEEDGTKLSLLVAAFMITKGIFRSMAFITLKPSITAKPTLLGGLASVLLGILLWSGWPFATAVWFIAFCLSVEIGLRGWALTDFAAWLETLADAEKKA